MPVRFATPEDAPALARMIAALRRHEGKAGPDPEAAQVAAWLDPADPMVEVLLAEWDGTAHGYLAFYRAFSLFKPGPTLLVENVYVDAAARGQGLGRALLAAAARVAVARGWLRLELNVAHDNIGAIAAYRRLGFAEPGEGVRRIEDAALQALAESEP
jgi:ribosomal protein S18 acetylase RimI-like enzyme